MAKVGFCNVLKGSLYSCVPHSMASLEVAEHLKVRVSLKEIKSLALCP